MFRPQCFNDILCLSSDGKFAGIAEGAKESKKTNDALHLCLFPYQAVWELVSEMEWLLPLAAAGSRGPFEVVRAAFVDSVTLSLKDISVTLSRVSKVVVITSVDLSLTINFV